MNNQIPTDEQWNVAALDIDAKSAYKVFFGKSNEDMQNSFYKCVIERVDELRFMPEIPFQYYILGFRDFITAGNFQMFEEADAASSFLKLIEFRLRNEPISIMPVIDELIPAVDYICSHQSSFDADVDIYGDFMKKKSDIHDLLPFK
jgi:hypothetical protein